MLIIGILLAASLLLVEVTKDKNSVIGLKQKKLELITPASNIVNFVKSISKLE